MGKQETIMYRRTRNYLHFKLGFSVQTSHKIMKRYTGDGFTTLQEAGMKIQSDWTAFMEWWGTNKTVYANSSRNGQKKNRKYSEWDDIREALQYTNGCADDF
jgi:hypothetical protein